MDLKELFASEGKLLLEDLKARGDSLLNTAAVEDRPLIERTLLRGVQLQSALFITPLNPGAKAEMASLINTGAFLEAKYKISLTREVRQFTEATTLRVGKFLLNLLLPT